MNAYGTTIQERLALKRLGMEPDILPTPFRVGLRDMGYAPEPAPHDHTGQIRYREDERYFRLTDKVVLRVTPNIRRANTLPNHLYTVDFFTLEPEGYVQRRPAEWVNTLDEVYQFV